jgi:CHC2 zinc finger
VNIEELVERLHARRSGKEWSACCPAHDDKRASLSIAERDQKILLHCFAGCTPEAVCAALGIQLSDLFVDSNSRANGSARVVASYNYTDEDGKLLFQVVRYQPKDFKVRRPSGTGWEWNLDGVEKVLYNLPTLKTAQAVLICEGEKDCDTARERFGAVATTCAGGAGKWKNDYGECLRGKRIVVVADGDEPGRRHADQIARALSGKVALLKVIELPGSKDLSDWIQAGGTAEALAGFIEMQAEWTPAAAPEAVELEALSVRDMSAAVLCGRLGEICDRRLLRQGLPIAYAWPALLTSAAVLVPPSNAIRTNLDTGLVGPLHSGKSVACEWGMESLGIVEPVRQDLMSGSAEGLIQRLANSDGQPRLLFPDELGHLLEKAKIERAAFPFVLNRAFYQSKFDLTAARRTPLRFNCALSVLGGVRDDDFQFAFGAMTTGGLWDRFIFGQCPQPHEFLYRPFEGGVERVDPVAIEIDRDIWALRDEWLAASKGNSRVAEIALRVAAICASFDGRHILRATDRELDAAKAFFQEQSDVRILLQPNPGETLDARCAFAIRTALERAKKGAWVNQHALYRSINGSRFGPGIFSHAISNMRYNGELESDTVPQ